MSTSLNAKYILISHNVQGFNAPTKRAKAFAYYHKQGADIVMLQETHFSKLSSPKYLNARYPQFYLSSGGEKKRGVAICFSRRTPFTPITVLRDHEGRYLMVVGRINDQVISLISYYAPNLGQTEFFQKMFAVLLPKVQGQLILGGDTNLPLDQVLDKTPGKNTRLRPIPKKSSILARLLHDNDLIDVWREANPSMRDYTFYSNVHKTYSRIDHFFACSTLLPHVARAKILTVSWSDHSPVHLSLADIWKKPGPSPWRLNTSLLKDPIILKEVEQALQAFFRENDPAETSPIVNWAAHKATIRGKLLQISARIKRNRESTISQQEQELTKLMEDQKKHPHIDIRHKIDNA